MAHFNAFDTKRRAHTVSRRGTDVWNPFRHIAWNSKPSRTKPGSSGGKERAGTWAPGQAEAQDFANTNQLDHAQTAPQLGQQNDDDREASLENGELPDADEKIGAAGGFRSTSGRGDATTPIESPMKTDEGGEPFATGANAAGASAGGAKPGALRSRPSSGAAAAAGGGDKGPDAAAVSHKTTEESSAKSQSAVVTTTDKKEKKSWREWARGDVPKGTYTVANQLQRTLLNSWINVLLVAAPVGIGLNFLPGRSGIMVFFVNFVAIIPLAAMLSFATEEIALRVGEVLGGLLNATFGNAVELIVAIIALKDDQIEIVQTSLIGSILSNLLLVLGMCFFCGGLNRPEQHFNTTVAQTATSLLALAVASVIVPTVFDVQSDTPLGDVAQLSRGTSVILLTVYAGYLFFQLKTHQTVFSAESQKVPAKAWGKSLKDHFHKDELAKGKVSQMLAGPAGLVPHGIPAGRDGNEQLSRYLLNPAVHADEDDEDDGPEEPQLHFFVALGTLVASTVVIAVCADYMVDGIHDLTETAGVREEFVGLILLPIVGNAAEHATAVTVAIKDKMDLAIGVAVGSSMQVALFLIPFLVVVGWGMGKEEMNLSFDVFQVAVLFVSVLLCNYLIADGKSHWLEGMQLVCLYFIIAVCSWWYPSKTLDSA